MFFGIVGTLLTRFGQDDWSDWVAYPFSGTGGKLALILAYLAYYLLTESLWGKSPAKFITRTRMIDSNGGDADWAAIFGRTLFRLIPLGAVSFLFGANRHDRF